MESVPHVSVRIALSAGLFSCSLARLWQRQDTRQDAYDLLVSVYGWLSEGFDT